MDMEKRINLFDSLKETVARESGSGQHTGFFITLAVIAALNLAVLGFLLISSQLERQRISALDTKLTEMEADKTSAEYEEASGKLAGLEDDLYALDMLSVFYDAYASFDSKMYNDITAIKPGNVTLESFSYGGGVATLNCTTPNDMPPADYTKALQDSGMFTSVHYSGFSTNQFGSVVFPIVCTIAG